MAPSLLHGVANRGRGEASRRQVYAIGFIAAVLAWKPYPASSASAGLHLSWQAGLAMGFEHHLQWGPQMIFTFGPFGFVDDMFAFFGRTTLISVVYALGVTWALAAMIVSGLRRSFGPVVSGVIAWVAVATAVSGAAGYSDVSSGTALGLALCASLGQYGPRRQRALVALGALAGFDLLVKLNDGLLATALAVLVVLWAPTGRGRDALRAGIPLVAVFFFGWVIARQSLGNLPSYIRGALSVTSGYAAAMGYSAGRHLEDAMALVVAACLAGVSVIWLARYPLRQRLGATVMLAVWTWAEVKEGFVRHDSHDLTFFGLALVAIALARMGPGHRAAHLCALTLSAILAFVAFGGLPAQVRSPLKDARAFGGQLVAVSGLGGQASHEAQLKARLIATGDSMPPPVLAELAGRTVAMEPLEDDIAYAYPQLQWDPEPVLQGYSAYTSYLDRLDASLLASRRAPERVVFDPSDVIDGRDQWLDPPGTIESMYCHYTQATIFGDQEVLDRVPDRCGPQTELGSASTTYGGVIDVPGSPGSMVVARMQLSTSLKDKITDLALRPPITYITVWAGGTERTYRFIPATAGDDNVMSVPPALGYSAPFSPPTIDKISISGGGYATGEGSVTVKFYAVAMAR